MLPRVGRHVTRQFQPVKVSTSEVILKYKHMLLLRCMAQKSENGYAGRTYRPSRGRHAAYRQQVGGAVYEAMISVGKRPSGPVPLGRGVDAVAAIWTSCLGSAGQTPPVAVPLPRRAGEALR
jgi:hypothetical protein